MIAADLERFWSKVSPEPNTGCWLWAGGAYSTGYGQFHINKGKNSRGAHVVAYELETGRTCPRGLHLDHLCRQPLCVNPRHLEAVTPRTNTLRGFGPSAKNAFATHCKHGHEFAGRNLYVWLNPKTGRSHRVCRECHRLVMARRKDGR